jgi:predicted transposase/invertase (TIGR01784 family)
MKYLDPKADLTFKKIFGNHPKRLISLLNALLPLSEEEQIHEIEYLPTELVPQLEGGKNTIVDVLCTDVRGRKFCVEMQMEWSDAFQQRVLFNASKLYVSQAKKGGRYSELQPVYSLNLINDIFAHDTPDFIHNYRIVHDKDSNKVIEGLHFTFIELPKFTPHSIADKRMMVLWLRFHDANHWLDIFFLFHIYFYYYFLLLDDNLHGLAATLYDVHTLLQIL